ncbi:hypothetical protein ACIQU6_07545 [Streptomyces sp. NPDC090442]|uniref:hypothetical protein n=1 Tax=Streptomyces sp. NPDC090442 TaxID=3365962 RepID=UPI003823EA20
MGSDNISSGSNRELGAGSSYLIQVRAGNERGWSAWSDQFRIKTKGVANPAAQAQLGSSARQEFAGCPWTLSYGGVLLGGSSPLIPVEVDGLASMPDVKDSDLELIQYDGLLPGRDYTRGRSVTMSFRALADNSEHLDLLMGEVSSAFTHSREEKPLEFCIPGVAQGAVAKVMGRMRKRSVRIDRAYGAMSPVVDVQFEATQPWITATDSLSRRLAVNSTYKVGGVHFPDDPEMGVTFPLFIPANGGFGGFTPAWVTNGSLDHSDLKVVVHGPFNGMVINAKENSRPIGRFGRLKWDDDTSYLVGVGERVEFEMKIDKATGKPTTGTMTRFNTAGEEIIDPPQFTQVFAAPSGSTIEVSIEVFKPVHDGAPSGYVEWYPGRFV